MYPYLVSVVVGAFVVVALLVSRHLLSIRQREDQTEESLNWLLVGLLLAAGFGLGAFVTYVMIFGH